MRTVITYGTYDLLHYGHVRLLERARELGDYLIVGVTSDEFDRERGKINVQQKLEERIAAVRKLGIADEIIIESYEGQKIDDIRKYDVDIFTVGSDWKGKFDYLKEYCEVVYLDRTIGVSSSGIRSRKNNIRLGIIGYSSFLKKFYDESLFVNSVDVVALCVPDKMTLQEVGNKLEIYTTDYNEMLERVDAVYVHSHPEQHYEQCLAALKKGKHVICESPSASSIKEYMHLKEVADKNNCIFMEALRTAYITGYKRLLLLLKSNKIGEVVAVDSTCTSLSSGDNAGHNKRWNAFEAWGATALLPVFQILGTHDYKKNIFIYKNNKELGFTRINISYPKSSASVKVGTGVKSEGELVISGTKGYIYVPAPWWKTEYFEIRFENPNDNKRYFFQVDGEGIRYELVAFAEAIRTGKANYYLDDNVAKAFITMYESIQGERNE